MSKMIYTERNSDYFKSNPTWHVEDSAWKATQVLQMIDKNKLAPNSIVEIGCGAGEILNQLQQRMEDKTIKFEGYEVAPEAYELSLTRQNDRLKFFHENLLDIDKKFDLLLMIDVFEHVDDYIGFIKKSKEKATYRIYHIPLDISVYSILINNFKHVRKSVWHIHYFNKETALATLRDSGQEIIDWFYTKGAFEVNAKNFTFAGKVVNAFRKFFYWLKPGLAVNMLGGFSLLVLAKDQEATTPGS